MFPLLPLLLCHFLVSAQSTSLPGQGLPQWSYEQRLNFASAALDVAVKRALTGKNGTLSKDDTITTPIFYAQLAELDIITQKTTYREIFKTTFPQAASSLRLSEEKGDQFFVYDFIEYGYAAIRAYVAYNDTTLLSFAESIWGDAWMYTISDSVVASGRIPSKTLGVRDSCNGKSLVGAVFEDHSNSTNGDIDPWSAGYFLTFSALLAESTKNSTYSQAAIQSLQFLKNFMYLPRENIGDEPWVYGLENKACNDQTSKGIWYPASGHIIEGAAILSSVTDDRNGSMREFLRQTIELATTLRESRREDGVIVLSSTFEDSGVLLPTGDPYLIRALGVACRRNQTLLTDDLSRFVNIQYNALLANATTQGSNIYGGSWIGPPAPDLDPVDQTYASMVLVHGITLGGNMTMGATSTSLMPTSPSPTPPRGTGPSSTETPATKSPPIRTIVAAVIGSLALVGVIISALFILRRRKHKHRQVESVDDTVSPFTPVSDLGNMEVVVPTKLRTTNLSPTLGTIARASRRPVSAPVSLDFGSIMDDPHARFNAMSTAEMVRILNARVQVESLRGEPPAYPRSQL